jgi:hypothetical protein
MIQLVQEAVDLIKDRPEEAKVAHWALTLDDEARVAFMLAWNIVHKGEEDERR